MNVFWGGGKGPPTPRIPDRNNFVPYHGRWMIRWFHFRFTCTKRKRKVAVEQVNTALRKDKYDLLS